jgi:GTP-binding protein
MFIDRVHLDVQAGKGGNGAISFLRLKFMEHGGPDGGGGGRGGSIYFQASKSETTLFKFKYQRRIIAADGENGLSKDRYGRSAEDQIIFVPVGTIVYEAATNIVIADLTIEGDKVLIAKGGRGGRGNATFKTSVNRSPQIAENGAPGDKKKLLVELKLLADVGLIGFPSVGKSSLLSVVSNAKPEIADYAFTTLVPNLGVVTLDHEPPFIIADLPGLIEGASQGRGLGLTFLRHIERCKVIIHLVDMSLDDDPSERIDIIHEELKAYSPALLTRPTIIAASKMDEPNAQGNLKKLKKKVKGMTIIPISILTHEGINELLKEALRLVKLAQMPTIDTKQAILTEKTYRYEDKPIFTIARPKSNMFIIQGEEVEAKYKKMNVTTDQGFLSLLQYLRKIKVEDALEKLGIKQGDTVILCDFEFTYYS